MEPDQNPADDAGDGVVPRPVVVEALARIGNDVALLQSAATLCLSDAELRTAVEQSARMRARLEAGYLHLLASLDSRPDAVPGAATGSAGATFLVHTVTMSPGQAHLDVKVAKALDAAGAQGLGASELGSAQQKALGFDRKDPDIRVEWLQEPNLSGVNLQTAESTLREAVSYTHLTLPTSDLV